MRIFMGRYEYPLYYDNYYKKLYINPEKINKLNEDLIREFLWKTNVLDKTKTTQNAQMYIEENNIVIQYFNWKIKIDLNNRNIKSFIIQKFSYRDESKISKYDNFILKVSKLINDISDVFWVHDASYIKLLVEHEDLFKEIEIDEWLRKFFVKFNDHYLYTYDLKEVVEHDKIIREKNRKYYTQPNRIPITNINGEVIGYYEFSPTLFEELEQPYIHIQSHNINDYKKLLEFLERNYEIISPEYKELVSKIIENIKLDIKTYEEFTTKYKSIINNNK